MASISALLWRKSYMLEFIEGQTVKECFAFSVPVESEEIDFPQRLSETKTFAGSFFEQYGSDTIKIALSGSTVNEEKKIVYQGTQKLPLYLTGAQEVFHLQSLISDWHKDASLTGNKKTYLYDLSKMNALQLVSGKPSRNWWRVFIRDFKIKRDKGNPHAYQYSIEMAGIVDDTPPAVSPFPQSVTEAIDKAQAALIAVQSAVDVANRAEQVIELSVKCAQKVQDVVRSYAALKGASGYKITMTVAGKADGVVRCLTADSHNIFLNSTKGLLAFAGVVSGQAKGTAFYTQKQSTSQRQQYYTVVFHANGGSAVSAQLVEYCDRATIPALPTRDRYRFDCWCIDEGLTAAYDFSQEVVGDLALYARWQLVTAIISYVGNTGVFATEKVSVGECAALQPVPTRLDGYRFTRWCADDAETMPFDFSAPIIEDTALYAGWERVHTVRFITGDGASVVSDQIISTGERCTYPLTPTKRDYTFSHWQEIGDAIAFDFSRVITADVALEAVFVRVSSTVHFESAGGTPIADEQVALGSLATEPAPPQKEGFVFVRWCTDTSLTNEFFFDRTPVTDNITLYALYEPRRFSVVFDSAGGSRVTSQSVGYGMRAVFPKIPTMAGKSFVRWEEEQVIAGDDGSEEVVRVEFDFSRTIFKDYTLYAAWI